MSVMQLDAVLLGDVQLNAHYDIFFSLFQLNWFENNINSL